MLIKGKNCCEIIAWVMGIIFPVKGITTLQLVFVPTFLKNNHSLIGRRSPIWIIFGMLRILFLGEAVTALTLVSIVTLSLGLVIVMMNWMTRLLVTHAFLLWNPRRGLYRL